MSLRAFTYACEALRQREQARFHVETPAVAAEPTPADMRERNAQSMSMLKGMLAGVQGAPRGPRRTR